jgi:hypothetical protein
LDPTVEEKTAAAVMGLPANGWWASAPLCVIFSALVWLGLRRGLGGVGSGALAAGLLTLVALCVDPLFAFPVALASIMARIHPLLGLAPTLYFLQPNILRELSFHGLIPPTLWGVVWLLAWPAFGCHGWRRPEAE